MKRRPKDSPVAVDSTPPATGDTRARRLYRLGLAFVTGAALAGVLVAVALTGTNEPDGNGVLPEHPTASARAQEQMVADLMEQHHCWRGAAPKDVQIPGHVVVTLDDGRTVYGGRFLTGQALEQIFGDVDHGLQVWGFCR